MPNSLILIADQSKATLYTVATPRGPLEELEQLHHPEGRGRAQELKSDRHGRSFDSNGQGRHAMGSSVDPREQESIRFAGEIAERLRRVFNGHRHNRLCVVAGPHFLGLLRDKLGKPSNLRITEIRKNLGQYNAREVRAMLPERL
jgi:protein required for attachment to host cells